MSAVLYGVPLSQPFRAVLWPLLARRVPFEVALAIPRAAWSSRMRCTLCITPRSMRPMLSNSFSPATEGWRVHRPPGGLLVDSVDSGGRWTAWWTGRLVDSVDCK